jgi:oligosaccharide repeat unit polymerase
MILVFIGALVMLMIINKYVAKSFLYPPVIFAALWAGLLFALMLSGDTFYPISLETMFLYYLGALAFSLGGIMALAVPRCKSGQHALISEQRRIFVHRMLKLGLIVLVAAFPFYLLQLQKISAASGFENFWMGLRYQITYGTGEKLGIFSYVIAIARFLALTAFYENYNARNRRLLTYAIIILAFTYDLLTVSRLGAMFLLFGLIGIAWIRSGKITWKPICIGVLAFLPLFSIAAILLGKGGNLNATFSENLFGVLKSLQVYTLGGLVAFDKVINNPSSFIGSQIPTFRFVFAVLNKFGAHFDLPAFNTQFTFTPAPTNVYTIYFSYFLDFGWTGTMIIMFGLGIFLTLIYLTAIRGNPQGAILYGIMFGSLMVSNANEAFLTALSYWLQAIIFTFLLYRWPLLPSRQKLMPVNISGKQLMLQRK